ncbi:MAG: hypothetical protein K9N23_15070 [Akkermansiaceae bacterium]|nr:hypothetical protein [Akkermansiaceae bacterium]
MKLLRPLLVALTGLSVCFVVWRNHDPTTPAPALPARVPANPAAPPPYRHRPPSPDGTGKIFMGREIAQVMGHAAIDWLERGERAQQEFEACGFLLVENRHLLP